MFFNKTPVRYLKWVGNLRLEDLKSNGIETIEDLLYCLPMRYEDRRNPTDISNLKPGETVLVTGILKNANLKRLKSRMTLIEAIIENKNEYLKAVWFNQPYLMRQMKPDDRVWLYGKVDYGKSGIGFQMNSPDLEIVRTSDGPAIHTGRIVPVYRQIKNTGTKMLRRIIYNTLFEHNAEIAETLPSAILRKRELMPKDDSIKRIHFPANDDSLDELQRRRSPMHRRLIYEEFLMMQASLFLIKKKNQNKMGIKFDLTTDLKAKAYKLPPFQLTPSQKKTIEEIFSDMSSPYPMNRLLQGDVGSGKTIVAFLSAYTAIKCGYQAALMVPTEILAEQHFQSASQLFAEEDISIALLTSSSVLKNGKKIYDAITDGHCDLVIGTHALIQKGVHFKNLGLVVIDEQHRFGVDQRKIMVGKGISPDTLLMTATPIPRSLALTAFGSLDLSVIDKLPSGRKQVETILSTDRKRTEVYGFIKKNLDRGRQAFVVCPLIQGSEKTDLKVAEQTYKQMIELFKDYTVDLLHGKMNSETKEKIMRRFSEGRTAMLVTTSVIEVGLDIPNANIMMIEHSERFGLSQLHQLRGRIGRGPYKSYCILMISDQKKGLFSHELNLTEQAQDRLKIMRESNNGFEISAKDLEIRGPGEFLGARQSGIPRFRIADLIRDSDILSQAYSDALWFFSLPNIEHSPDYEVFIKTLREWWKDNFPTKAN